jgi:protein gp37
MGERSNIGWTDASWNFTYGCQKAGDECKFCYAMGEVYRMAGNPNPKISAGKADLVQIVNGRPQWTGKFLVVPERLELPLSWRRPRMIFVNSLSDLFYGGLPQDADEMPWDVFCQMMDVMRRANWHIYQVLTKRGGMMAERLHSYAATQIRQERSLPPEHPVLMNEAREFYRTHFPHVWWGISAGTQKAFDQATHDLLANAGAVRWLSMEPLLESVEVATDADQIRLADVVDWIVVGGESQKGARPTALTWYSEIIQEALHYQGVPVFVKQLGEPWAATHRIADRTPKDLGDKKGIDMQWWPQWLRVRQYPLQPVERWLTDHVRPWEAKQTPREKERYGITGEGVGR